MFFDAGHKVCINIYLLNFILNVFIIWFWIFFYSIGFEFSDAEPSALVQKQGGPCAVIAPVQAYILKTLVMDTSGQLFKNVLFFTVILKYI